MSSGTVSRPRVVFGLGTGRHLVEPVLRGERLVVFAVDVAPGAPEEVPTRIAGYPEVVAAMERGQLEVVVADVPGVAARFQRLAEASSDAPTVDVHLPALDAAPPDLQQLARTVERVHLEHVHGRAVPPRMIENLQRNVEHIARAASLEAVRGLARGFPGFVVAAGPSARAALGFLRTAGRLGPVVAVDTIWPLFATAGLEVDCLATVDPHRESLDHLRGGTRGIDVLAFQPYAMPDLVEASPRRMVALPAGDRLFDACAAELGFPRVQVVGTVLLYALQVAEMMGCSPIVVLGADLAHVGGLTHARGSARARVRIASGATVLDARGEPVPTSRMLLRFHAAIEQHVAGSKTPHWFVDGGGARISGARMVALDRVRAELGPRSWPRPAGGLLGHEPGGEGPTPRQRELILRRFLAEFGVAARSA
jgi:hypothetical protein